MSQHLDTLKIASETVAGVLSRFSVATATTTRQLKSSSNNEQTVKSTAFGCRFGKSEGDCQRNRKLRADPTAP